MRPIDARLDQLLGTGAAAFRASFDLVPDPIGVLWALRYTAGAVIDFETGYSNPAMDRMLGVSLSAASAADCSRRPPASAMTNVQADARGRGDRHAGGRGVAGRAQDPSPGWQESSCTAPSRSDRTR